MDRRIAFSGKAGSGKTTAAQYLEDHKSFTRLSFADRLRAAAEHIWGPDARSDRDKLQRLGIKVREIDEDAWVNAAIRRFELMENDRLVIDDMRFPNEYWRLKEEGFVLVRVTAALHTRIDRLRWSGKWQNDSQLEHVSETALDDYQFDYGITNTGTHTDLAAQLDDIVYREASRV